MLLCKYIEENVCVTECSPEFPYIDGDKCVKSCDYMIDGVMCVKECNDYTAKDENG